MEFGVTPIAVEGRRLEAAGAHMDDVKDGVMEPGMDAWTLMQWRLHFAELKKEHVIREISETAPQLQIPFVQCDEKVTVRV